ncbi:hypothetical protein C8R44DRAFT_740569 [Mycena epipterygia]|nr:hypothetical protein C8R44DRAFT_740569 [Mycena epipterygia]
MSADRDANDGLMGFKRTMRNGEFAFAEQYKGVEGIGRGVGNTVSKCLLNSHVTSGNPFLGRRHVCGDLFGNHELWYSNHHWIMFKVRSPPSVDERNGNMVHGQILPEVHEADGGPVSPSTPSVVQKPLTRFTVHEELFQLRVEVSGAEHESPGDRRNEFESRGRTADGSGRLRG